MDRINTAFNWAFVDAIEEGRLSEYMSDRNFSGYYIFLGTDSKGVDQFENIYTHLSDV